MKHGGQAKLPFVLYRILQNYSDRDHFISMPALLSLLEEEGLTPASRTVIVWIKAMQEEGIDIRYVNKKFEQGYYLEHTMVPEHAWLFLEAVSGMRFLSRNDYDTLSSHIYSALPSSQSSFLKKTVRKPPKEKKASVLEMIRILLKAIEKQYTVSFRYFDFTIDAAKKYRRRKERYVLMPYALTSMNGRLYCIFYSEKYHDFANYRLDKMEDLMIVESRFERIPFDLDHYLETSFGMYHGQPETITLECDLDFANILFDEFGTRVIISKVSETSFTVSIRTAIAPTLLSWLFQFYDRVTVLSPQSLADALEERAAYILKKYQKREV